MKHAKGFTLIETLVVLAIVAILARYAYPSYQKLIRGSRLSGQSTLVLTSLYQARSEAIRRVKYVTVCPSDYGNGGTLSCTAKSTWANGWIAFIPTTANQVSSGWGTATGGEVLVAQGKLANSNTLTSCRAASCTATNAFGYLTYDPNGIATVDSAPNLPYMCFLLFDSKGTAVVNGIEVQMSITGRPASRTTTSTTSC
ncbi:MAG TPA: GspH/FimT family pseudopilin [Gammaproteobacteria bacterium]|nr:GspH/FimT family pseudopilin [Gammaproteobacteria bacterium]